MAQDTLLSNKASIAQHFILDQYLETVFQGIIPNTSVAKVLSTRKSQFKALQCKMPEIKLDTTCANEVAICFRNRMPLNSICTV